MKDLLFYITDKCNRAENFGDKIKGRKPLPRPRKTKMQPENVDKVRKEKSYHHKNVLNMDCQVFLLFISNLNENLLNKFSNLAANHVGSKLKIFLPVSGTEI